MSSFSFKLFLAENQKRHVKNWTQDKSICFWTIRHQEKAPHLILFSLHDESYVVLPDVPVETCVHDRYSTKLDAQKSTETCNSFVLFVHRKACARTRSLRQVRVVAVTVRAGKNLNYTTHARRIWRWVRRIMPLVLDRAPEKTSGVFHNYRRYLDCRNAFLLRRSSES